MNLSLGICLSLSGLVRILGRRGQCLSLAEFNINFAGLAEVRRQRLLGFADRRRLSERWNRHPKLQPHAAAEILKCNKFCLLNKLPRQARDRKRARNRGPLLCGQ